MARADARGEAAVQCDGLGDAGERAGDFGVDHFAVEEGGDGSEGVGLADDVLVLGNDGLAHVVALAAEGFVFFAELADFIGGGGVEFRRGRQFQFLLAGHRRGVEASRV